MTKNRPSAGYLYDVALLLVCLALLSSCFASGLLAKYVSKNDAGSEARVAKWSATISAGTTMELPAGGTEITYPITVNVNAETAWTCNITIVFDEDMSSVISNPHIGTVAPDEGSAFTDTLTFTKVGSFPATDGSTVTATFDLVFEVGDITAVDDYDNDIINGSDSSVPFDATVTVVQVD